MLQQMRASAKWIWALVAIAFIGGFLLLETSGLVGRATITPNTAVATVNGRDILYTTWVQTAQRLAEEESQRLGRALTLDEQRQIEDQAFEQLVGAVLLEQEYDRRGIVVTDAEIQREALYSPPPQLLQSPDLQTEGRFDMEKYRRFLSSPSARQGGLLAQLEQYYRDELPRRKLFSQVAAGVYLTDARLWRIFQDQRDSALVSYVAFRPQGAPRAGVQVTDAQVREYYEENRAQLERPGRAVVSLLELPRVVTAADSAATVARVRALREEITSGRSTFEDVARRESIDTASAVQGGLLPPGGRGRFVEPFERAAYALSVGEVSQPVRTQFGVHLIKLDARRGDTLTLRHLLVPYQVSDTAATRIDRLADQLDRLAGGATSPARFDSAARALGLTPRRVEVLEGQPLLVEGRYIPSVSAWAFDGAVPGESSELFADDAGYYMARLDTLAPGGVPPLEAVSADIRAFLTRRAEVQALVPTARELAAAAATSSLEEAARQRGLTVATTPLFSRVGTVPGLGRLNQAIGAAFALPVGAVSAPIETPDAVYVIRVDRRVEADSAVWVAQKAVQREMLIQQLRQQRVQEFLENLRRAADIEDRRRELNAIARQSAS